MPSDPCFEIISTVQSSVLGCDRVFFSNPGDSSWRSITGMVIHMRTRRGEIACLMVLLAVVGLRPLLSESFHTTSLSITRSLKGTSDPWVAVTLVLDVLVLSISALVVARRWRRGYLPTGLEWGTVVFVVAAVVSSTFAADKRPAITAATNMVANLALAIALTQLLDTWWKRWLTIAIIVASGASTAAECADQHFRTFAESASDYANHREAIWSKQGVPLDAPRVRLFEQRMASCEASGYFAHSNVAGGYLALVGFVALGAGLWGGAVVVSAVARRGAGRETDRDAFPLVEIVFPVVAMMIVTAGIWGAVLLTKSLGALVAVVAGLGLLLIVRRARSWLGSHRRLVFVCGWSLVAGGALAVVGHGLYHGSLPSASMAFRWQYWTVSAEMFRDHWLTGVGAENFGDHYLAYKKIASPEEIKSPHSFPVQFATEYGLFGLTACLLLLVGASRRLTASPRASGLEVGLAPSPASPASPPSSSSSSLLSSFLPSFPSPSSASMLLMVLLLAAGIFGPRTRLLGSGDVNFVYWMTAFPLMFWLLGMGAVLLVARASMCEGAKKMSVFSTALNCGLFAFLLQDLINFSVFIPGAATTFFSVLAVSVSWRNGDAPNTSNTNVNTNVASISTISAMLARWRTTAIAVALVLSAIVAMVNLPAPLGAELVLRRARAAELPWQPDAPPLPTMVQQYERATHRDRFDATAPAELSGKLLKTARVQNDPRQRVALLTWALQANQTALDRAPLRVSFWRRRARLFVERSQATGNVADYRSAIEAARRVVELYPTMPEAHIDLGTCLASMGDCKSLGEAVAAYREALAIDDRRPTWEKFRRFTSAQRAALQTLIAQTQANYDAQCL